MICNMFTLHRYTFTVHMLRHIVTCHTSYFVFHIASCMYSIYRIARLEGRLGALWGHLYGLGLRAFLACLGTFWLLEKSRDKPRSSRRTVAATCVLMCSAPSTPSSTRWARQPSCRWAGISRNGGERLTRDIDMGTSYQPPRCDGCSSRSCRTTLAAKQKQGPLARL